MVKQMATSWQEVRCGREDIQKDSYKLSIQTNHNF